MTFERRIARLVGMTHEGWARHANVWSVWTRFTGSALLMLAAWSRAWLGWWALAAGAAIVVWIAVNPFVFAKPVRTDTWPARGVLGERIWMYRDRIAIPRRHLALPPLLNGINALGFAAALYGVVVFDPWTTLLGLGVHYLAKAWFVDRMAWLADDMRAGGDMDRVTAIIEGREPDR